MAVTLRKSTDTVRPSAPCTFNTPCASAGRSFSPLRTIAGKPVAKTVRGGYLDTNTSAYLSDNSDGYGGTYAVGE